MRIPVAVRDLAGGTVVRAEDLRWIQIPHAYTADLTLAHEASIVGKTTLSPILAGEQFRLERLELRNPAVRRDFVPLPDIRTRLPFVRTGDLLVPVFHDVSGWCSFGKAADAIVEPQAVGLRVAVDQADRLQAWIATGQPLRLLVAPSNYHRDSPLDPTGLPICSDMP